VRGVPRPVADGLDAVLEATVLFSFSRFGSLTRRRLFGWDEPASGSMAGRTVVLTGATGGMGSAIATALSRLGATVWLVGRNEIKTAALASRIRAEVADARVETAVADLTRLPEVRELAARLLAGSDRLDVLIHNAGVLMNRHELTTDGIETTAQVHLVAPFLLTSLLLPKLRETAGARVITVSSGGMYTRKLNVAALDPAPAAFNGVAAYAATKRAQVALTEEAARRCQRSDVTFHVTHPGWVDTPGLRTSLPRFEKLVRPMLRSPQQGADTIVWLASAPRGAAWPGGQFWHDRRPRSTVRLPGTATPGGERARLWDWTTARAGVVPARASGTTR
jgi:dehydrogenase/reductase SDR family member 12